MSDHEQSEISLDGTTTYEIRIKGHPGQGWEDWFDTTRISQTDDGETILICTVKDQPALYGLLRRIRDLGVPLISVVCVATDNTE